jgi:gluconokinase
LETEPIIAVDPPAATVVTGPAIVAATESVVKVTGLAQACGQGGAVVSCSALKRAYRDRLRAAAPALRLVHLHGEPALLSTRMQARVDHYMPPSLLQSQLDTLELPLADEHAIRGDAAEPPEALVMRIAEALAEGVR